MADGRERLIREEADSVVGIPANVEHEPWLSEPDHTEGDQSAAFNMLDDEQSGRQFIDIVMDDYSPEWRNQAARLATKSAVEAVPSTYRYAPFLQQAVKDGIAKAFGLKPLDELKEGEV